MAKHIVLVHGAWQGSWSFGLIIPFLENSGWTIHAIDLPGNGWNTGINQTANLEHYSHYLIDVIKDINEPVTLLGHSGGGLVISAVAEKIPHLIEHLVYLVGMMLPSNMTFIEFKSLCEQYYPNESFDGISPYLSINALGESAVSAEGARKIFLQDCEPELATELIQKLRPQPESGRDLSPVLTESRFGSVPRLYVEALYDQSLPIHMQRLMQKLQPNNLCVISMKTGHVPQAIQPELLVDRLNQALN